jgi:hypothetical protein
LGYNKCKKIEKETEMKKILIGVVASIAVLASAPASAQYYGHYHGNRDGAILGAVIGGVILGQVINNQRPQVIVQQPQVIYQQPQVIYQQAPQQVCEVKMVQDQFGQVREFTACYYR